MPLDLIVLPNLYAVCRLEAASPFPTWAKGEFVSVTRTAQELSIVCEQQHIPPDIRRETDWRCVRVAGTLDFSMTGIISSLTQPLAEAEISVFVLSTFDTDYVMVQETNLERALEIWQEEGFSSESR